MSKALEKAASDVLNALSPFLDQVTRHLEFWEQQDVKNDDKIDIQYEGTSIRDMHLISRKSYLLGKQVQAAEDNS